MAEAEAHAGRVDADAARLRREVEATRAEADRRLAAERAALAQEQEQRQIQIAAERAHAAWPELAELSAQLRAQWPERARGVQRIVLGDGVTLTLFVDEIAASLPQARAQCDAWVLDGFAPAKNPEMPNDTDW